MVPVDSYFLSSYHSLSLGVKGPQGYQGENIANHCIVVDYQHFKR